MMLGAGQIRTDVKRQGAAMLQQPESARRSIETNMPSYSESPDAKAVSKHSCAMRSHTLQECNEQVGKSLCRREGEVKKK